MKAKRILTVLVATVTVVSMLGAPSTAAPKTWSKIMLSRDGRTWSKTLSNPLFSSGYTWVPGDRQTQRFYVRNNTGGKARLGLVVTLDDRSGLLRTRQLRMAVQVATGRWVTVARASGQQLVNITMAAGAVKPVNVRVWLVPGAGNSSMRKREPFKITVRLTSLPKR